MNRLRPYSAFPRVRSNSLSTLTVTPPPSSSRQVISSPPRLPSEGPKQQSSQHSQLALTQPPAGLQPPLFPLPAPLAPSFIATAPSPAAASFSAHAAETPRAAKRQRLNYHLDVGAYGIPKHRQCRPFHSQSHLPHSALSIQVGEDAYFVRDNAMGIADGVGGWSRSVHPSAQHPTPSALFSRRLMHFCSAEIDALSMPEPPDSRSIPSSGASTARPPATKFSFEHHLKPRQPAPSDQYSFSELEDSLHSSLEELSEGIDVLNILERAYDSTVKAHLAPASPTPTPLTTGSSTALLAVLDHPPSQLSQFPEPPFKNYAAGSVPALPLAVITASSSRHEDPDLTSKSRTPSPLSHTSPSTSSPNPATTTTTPSSSDATSDAPEIPQQLPYDAVLRIAHLGDCMGMLVRGDTIVWRSDEMWWGYNHPLQLGPPATCGGGSAGPGPTEPHRLPVQPHTFSLPVRADDILILASDGLSDNLWDEDVLDEVLKFRRKEGWGFGEPIPSNVQTDDNAGHLHSAFASLNLNLHDKSAAAADESSSNLLRRKAFAGMLSEALCSRAKRVSERRPAATSSSHRRRQAVPPPKFSVIAEEPDVEASTKPRPRSPSVSIVTSEEETPNVHVEEDEVPFARRARLAGKVFKGGKHDDISVIVAVISPAPPSSPDGEDPSSHNTATSESHARL